MARLPLAAGTLSLGLKSWRVTGRTNPDEAFIWPTDSVPITVIDYQLVKI